MPDLSFDILDAKGFLQMLIEDFHDFKQNSTSSRLAIHCAMDAWHLTEWVYHENHAALISIYPQLHDYQRWIKSQCTEMQIMHDISNGSKHYLLKRHNSLVDRTEVHRGSFSNDFSRDFDISSTDVHMKDGTRIYFEDAIEATVNFWTKFLQQNYAIAL